LFIASLVVGLLLSAWYWLPGLAETGYVQLTTQTTGYFFYGNHFRGADLVQPRLIFNYVITPGDPTPFATGFVQAALALVGVLVVIAGWAHSPFAIRHSRFAILGLALCTWLITPLSRPLWDHLPLLPMVQFPWRFLSVQALFTALLTGAIPSLASPPVGRRGWAIAVVLAGVLAVTGLVSLRSEYLPITAEEVTVERLQLYELFTGNVGSTIRYEYLPHWVMPRPYTGPALFDPSAPPRAIPLNGELVDAKETAHEPTRRIWTVEAGAGGAEVAFPLYYWPGWRATVDGAPVEVKPAPDSGYLTLAVPAGRHMVVMWLGRTPLRLGTELTSLATALILVVLGVIRWWQSARCKMQDAGGKIQSADRFLPPASCLLPLASCFVGLAITLTLLVTFSPRIAITGDSDLTMDFEQMPYLHHNPGGVDFGWWQMTGYHYSADRLAPGRTLHITLDWQAVQGENSATLRLVSPAAVRQGELPAIAEATAHPPLTPPPGGEAPPTAHWTGSTTLELPVPQDVAPGLYLIHLEGGDGGAESVYLQPVWVGGGEGAAGQLVSGAFADGALRLHTVEAAQIAPDRLNLRLDWSAARPVAANYGLRLRLTDPAGNEWATPGQQPLDTQPGYGFLPTSLWPVGHLIHDRYTLSLPQGTPPGDGYTLTVSLYRAMTWESVGEFASPVSLDQATQRPDAQTIAHFGDELALSRLKVSKRVRQGERLPLTAYWLAVERPSKDYVAEWWLEAIENSQFAIRNSQFVPLAPGSPPTAWPVGAWVAGRAALPIPPTAPPGDYTLSLTLRNPISGASLGTCTHPQPVHVLERERVWELPPMQQEVGARFGGMIELAGYDLKREGDTLHLTLHWRALTVPDRHYMLFVHLADPTTGRPVAQVDTMPRGFTYPTGLWAPGEVISDEVVLSLEGVPAGQYDLAVGWYEPNETSQRLQATDRTDNPLPDGRLVLSDSVMLP